MSNTPDVSLNAKTCAFKKDCFAKPWSPTSYEKENVCCARWEVMEIDTKNPGYEYLAASFAVYDLPTT